MTILRSHHILTYQYQCTAGGGRQVTRTCPASYEGSLQHSTSYILFKQYSTVQYSTRYRQLSSELIEYVGLLQVSGVKRHLYRLLRPSVRYESYLAQLAAYRKLEPVLFMSLVNFYQQCYCKCNFFYELTCPSVSQLVGRFFGWSVGLS